MASLNLRLAPLPRIAHSTPMGEGRLIWASKYRSDLRAVAYLVAVHDKAGAIDFIREKVASLGDEVEDLGRVSDALLTALSLAPGQFAPVSAIRHGAQQGQQPQAKNDKPN